MAAEIPFSWPDKLIGYFLKECGSTFLLASALCSTHGTHASFFSGMGTSELAWQMIHASLSAHGLALHLYPGFVCENERHCLSVLARYTLGHIFGDIMDLLTLPEVDPSWDFMYKKRIVMEAAVRSSAFCLRARQYAAVGRPVVTSSGVPCQDFSSVGNRKGLEGKTAHLLLAWMRWHLVMRIPVVLLENVPQFCLDVINDFMGKQYFIIAVLCGPEHVGFAFSHRPRLYVALLLKGSVIILRDIHKTMSAACKILKNGTKVRDLFIASPQEIEYETTMLFQRRCHMLHASGAILPHICESQLRMLNLMTANEHQRVMHYTQLWLQTFHTVPRSEPDLVFGLSDNPGEGWVTWSAPTMKGGGFSLPVMRTGRRMYWIPSLQRFMTISEKMAFMGFPSHQKLAHASRSPCSVMLSWDEEGMIGNAMHLANIGVWQAVVLACIQLVK